MLLRKGFLTFHFLYDFVNSPINLLEYRNPVSVVTNILYQPVNCVRQASVATCLSDGGVRQFPRAGRNQRSQLFEATNGVTESGSVHGLSRASPFPGNSEFTF